MTTQNGRSKWPRTTEGCSNKCEGTDSDIVRGPVSVPHDGPWISGAYYECIGVLIKWTKKHGRFKVDGRLTA
ncbi:hypothetical protein LX32DRAFT_636624 [Colletotrichum zoysiae]|uniref:Uncharacterized protein n=1 Tax=Colletotrichum zoysiae TaxID=1216348 RepID=A0AAD9HPX8_9PEZI|nr:hypothetical protein LX32DRAFT_636624 [Colletotrichum zoysiae]